MLGGLIYFLVFAFVFFLNTKAVAQTNVKKRKYLIVASFITLLLFIGLRYNVGTDYDNYLAQYNMIQNISWERLPTLRLELFVAGLFKTCSYILWDPKLIFMVMGFFLLYPVYRANKLFGDYKYLAYSVLTFSVLFLPFGLNGMRQGIAMGFGLLAFLRFMKNDYKRGIIDFIISTLFHTSAWILLPYLALITVCKKWKINFTIMNIIMTTVVSLTVLFFLNDLLLRNGITQYEYMLENTSIERITFTGILVYIPIIIMILLFRGGEGCRYEELIMKNLTISGIFLFTIGTSAQYLSRFGLYYMVPSIILLPELILNTKLKTNSMRLKVLFVAYLALFFIVQYCLLGRQEIIPYQTWIFGV